MLNNMMRFSIVEWCYLILKISIKFFLINGIVLYYVWVCFCRFGFVFFTYGLDCRAVWYSRNRFMVFVVWVFLFKCRW